MSDWADPGMLQVDDTFSGAMCAFHHECGGEPDRPAPGFMPDGQDIFRDGLPEESLALAGLCDVAC